METSQEARARNRKRSARRLRATTSSSATLPGSLRRRPRRQRTARCAARSSGGDARGRPARGTSLAAGSPTTGHWKRTGDAVEGPPSTPALADYFSRLGIALEPGWRAEVNLRAIDWIRDASARLRRGFIILIDYGHEARELYSATHAGGTLTSFSRHVMAGPESGADTPPWLERPGEQDLTAHVDFTSVRAAAEREGLATLGFLDQTYFVLGLLTGDGR